MTNKSHSSSWTDRRIRNRLVLAVRSSVQRFHEIGQRKSSDESFTFVATLHNRDHHAGLVDDRRSACSPVLVAPMLAPNYEPVQPRVLLKTIEGHAFLDDRFPINQPNAGNKRRFAVCGK